MAAAHLMGETIRRLKVFRLKGFRLNTRDTG
jgi:hypothetical protein